MIGMTMARAVGRHVAGNAVGYVALSVAMGGGTAYAVNEWTGDNIVNGSLTAVDLATGSVTGPKVAVNAVDGTKVLDNSLRGADINEGTLTRVPDSELLDGVDSTAFAKGQMLSGFLTIPDNTSGELFAGNDVFNLKFTCPSDPIGQVPDTLTFFNNTSTQANLYSDNGGSNPAYRKLARDGTLGDSYDQTVLPSGDLVTFQTQSSLGRFATVWVSVNNPTSTTCHIQAQALTN
jgi:hypothetical protein